MTKETKFTIELNPKEISDILLEKYKKQYPQANLQDVTFILGSDPRDDGYGMGAPSKVLKSIKIVGVIEEEI